MKASIRFLQVLGTATLALLVACGDSSSTTDGGGTAGTAGATAGTGGKATGGTSSTGGEAGSTSTGGKGGTDAGGTDAGGTDAGGTDAGGTDAGGTDAGGTDAGGTDAGGTDAGGTDAGGTDAGGTDAGGTDAGGTDAGGTDAGGTDAGGTDAGGTDAGGTDAGGTDAGGTDAGGTNAGGTDAGGTDAGGTSSGGTSSGGTSSGGSSSGGSSSGGSSSGGSSSGGNGNGGFCPFPPCDGGGGSAGSAGSGTTCNSKNGEDNDKDGYPFPQDCNDCDPETNPGALDVFNYDPNTGAPLPADKQVDEDCSGSAVLEEKPTCDTGLVLAENDPIKGANAMDICQTTTANSPKWGIISATYVQLDGTPIPANGGPFGGIQPALGHGIMASFGANVQKELGANMLVLSSGTARTPGQAGYSDPGGSDKGYQCANPKGFPVNSPACPGVQSGALHDSIALKLRLRAPTNAKSISFKFKFYTYEFPQYICSTYNDIFVAIMKDKNGNFIPGADATTGNISFDKQKNLLSVNAGFLDVCTAQQAGGKNFTCDLGPSELQGTGFESHAGTGWLQTTAPVNPGEEFELLFGISDAGDGVLSSTVLLDSFEWSANAGQVQTGNECKLGGSGTCTSCLSNQIPKCCDAEYTACINDKEGQSGSFNPGCNGILNCIQICAGNAQCQQQCYDSRPNGQPEYNAYRDCLYGPAGSTDDFGACGKVCQ